MLLWQQAEGKRHAYEGSRAETIGSGTPFLSLCGAEVTPKQEDVLEFGAEWSDPFCEECEREWTARTGVKPGCACGGVRLREPATWSRSNWDLRVHAWRRLPDIETVPVALCGHWAPASKVASSTDSEPCATCARLAGELDRA